MTLDTAIAAAAIVLVLLWPVHQELTIRALRHSLRRQRAQLAQHRRAIIQLQGAATQPPTSVGQPMPTRYDSPELCRDPDRTLRLARPPALSDLASAILTAERPLTRANLDTKLGRDTRTEVRNGLLAGTLQMVRTHDDEPAYWPTTHPVPGDTIRMAKMSVLPGVSR